MKGRYKGPMSIGDFRQALFQDCHTLLDGQDESVQVRNATIYINFCDGHGRPVDIYDPQGRPIDGFVSAGAYPCAADRYDDHRLEPEIETRTMAVEVKTPPAARSADFLPFAPF